MRILLLATKLGLMGNETNIASFDVFETLLIRAVGDPSAVFLILGRRAKELQFVQCEAAVFAGLRREAERCWVSRSGGLDPSLKQIYLELSKLLALTDQQTEALAALELKIEEALLFKRPGANEIVTAARDKYDKIIFVSDSYLPQEFIKECLRKSGLFLKGDSVYVSCAYGGDSKRTGKLWRRVLDNEGVAARSIVHTGNSRKADVSSARRFGLKAVYRGEANLNRYEQSMERWKIHTGGVSSYFAGGSRHVRLALDNFGGTRGAVSDVVAGVIGPAIASFLLAALCAFSHRNIARIYFVTPEGSLLKDFAEILSYKLSLNFDLRTLNLVSSIALAQSCSSRCPVPEDDNDHSDREGASGWTLYETYLENTGFFDATSIGLICLVRSGCEFQKLNELRVKKRLSRVESFAFYLRESAESGEAGSTSRGWFLDEVHNLGYGPPPGTSTFGASILVQASAMMGEQSVDELQSPIDGVRSEKACLQDGSVTATDRAEVVGALKLYFLQLYLDTSFIDRYLDLRPMVRDLLSLLWMHPSNAEAQFWGRIAFSRLDHSYDKIIPIANPLGVSDVMNIFKTGNLEPRFWFDWRPASVARSRRIIRLACSILDNAVRLKRSVMRFARRE